MELGAKKIKVAFMSYAMDNRSAMGTARYTRELAKYLVEDERLEVSLIHYEKSEDPVYTKAREIVMPHFLYPSRFLRQLYFFWKYRHEQFDIIHWTQPRAYPGYWWAPARHKVITIHGGGKYYYPFFNISARMFHIVVRYLNQWFGFLIVSTEFAKGDAAATYKLHPDRLRVTHLGGSEHFLPLSHEESFGKIVQTYPHIGREFVLTISRLQPHKNINNLIRGYDLMRANHPDRNELLVIVAQPAADYEETYALARASTYADDIIFIDYVPEGLLNTMYAAGRLFVFPSLSEGFGLPLVEAMGSGTPVVTSSVSCMPEVVADAGILCDPYNPEDIARALNEGLGDEALRAQCRERGILRAATFTWRRMAEKTGDIYAELVKP